MKYLILLSSMIFSSIAFSCDEYALKLTDKLENIYQDSYQMDDEPEMNLVKSEVVKEVKDSFGIKQFVEVVVEVYHTNDESESWLNRYAFKFTKYTSIGSCYIQSSTFETI